MKTIHDIEQLEEAMRSIGFDLIQNEGGTMDSGVATFKKEGKEIRIIKDRSQWMFSTARNELEPLGFFHAYNSTEEFKRDLLAYATHKK
jgi:hypothetical protein